MPVSKKTALARQVVLSVINEVDVDESPGVRRLVSKGKTVEVARRMVLSRTARTALTHTRGDEEAATHALVIVNAKGNRLPQCVSLMRRFGTEVARAAYRLQEELQFSHCTLINMCRIISALGYIPDEDDDQIAEILDEIAIACDHGQKLEGRWIKRLPRLIREHDQLIDAVRDFVIDKIRGFQGSRVGILTVEDEEEFWESCSSYEGRI